MSNMKELSEEVMNNMGLFKKNNPEQIGAFHQFHSATLKDGNLDKKTKELIALALGVKAQCKWCISLHLKGCLEAKATPEEIREASWVAVMMGGGPSLMYHQLVEEGLKDFSE